METRREEAFPVSLAALSSGISSQHEQRLSDPAFGAQTSYMVEYNAGNTTHDGQNIHVSSLAHRIDGNIQSLAAYPPPGVSIPMITQQVQGYTGQYPREDYMSNAATSHLPGPRFRRLEGNGPNAAVGQASHGQHHIDPQAAGFSRSITTGQQLRRITPAIPVNREYHEVIQFWVGNSQGVRLEDALRDNVALALVDSEEPVLWAQGPKISYNIIWPPDARRRPRTKQWNVHRRGSTRRKIANQVAKTVMEFIDDSVMHIEG
ncbi:hypothetical protein BC629DRAFT_1520388 [Irpex lacteus]|nr:hypothetical protein BC629DRAFT_1520388 [Irpex lacteus]